MCVVCLIEKVSRMHKMDTYLEKDGSRLHEICNKNKYTYKVYAVREHHDPFSNFTTQRRLNQSIFVVFFFLLLPFMPFEYIVCHRNE